MVSPGRRRGAAATLRAARNAAALLLSLQLSEMGLPYTLCLNMADEARDHGIQIDSAALSEALCVPVIDIVATQKVGLVEAKRRTLDRADKPRPIPVDYPAPILASPHWWLVPCNHCVSPTRISIPTTTPCCPVCGLR